MEQLSFVSTQPPDRSRQRSEKIVRPTRNLRTLSPEDGRDIRISNTLELGKAAEHLVCADLILQGYSATLAASGLPYDIIIHTAAGLKSMQVKATAALTKDSKSQPVYRFILRRGGQHTGAIRTFGIQEADYYAFVALDIRTIAYFRNYEIISRNGHSISMLMEFKSPAIEYRGRLLNSGLRGAPRGKWMDRYQEFRP